MYHKSELFCTVNTKEFSYLYSLLYLKYNKGMKIEKINETQIRCTLYREDLEKRHMKLSELAYGTENARVLFSEMMKFAYTKYGFSADDAPLMIEAIPVSEDSVILNITKVEYPEELDTRFSRFSEYDEEEYEDIPFLDENSDPSEISFGTANAAEIIDAAKDTPSGDIPKITRIFSFKKMDDIIAFSRILSGFFVGENSLYKSDRQDIYYLVMKNGSNTPAAFNKICNIATEYGSLVPLESVSEEFFSEHYKTIAEGNALETLAAL